ASTLRSSFHDKANAVIRCPKTKGRLFYQGQAKLTGKMFMKRRKQTLVVKWITTIALLVSMCASFTFSQRTTAQSSQGTKSAGQRDPSVQGNTDYPVLSKYATDLTQLALEGKLDPP